VAGNRLLRFQLTNTSHEITKILEFKRLYSRYGKEASWRRFAKSHKYESAAAAASTYEY
jgi:hypothetical protein